MFKLYNLPFNFTFTFENKLETEKKHWLNGLQIRGNLIKHYCLAFRLFSKGFLFCYSSKLKCFSLDIFKLI